MRKLKPISTRQYLDVIDAEQYLIRAIKNLKRADCPRAAARVEASLKSVQGAVRHAKHRWHATLEKSRKQHEAERQGK